LDGPLKIESDDDPTPETVKCVINEFLIFLSDTASRHLIGEEVQRLEHKHAADLGQYAEFWLTLAIGAELTDPYHVYGTKMSVYRGRAMSCANYKRETLVRYTRLTVECHQQRESFSSGRINPDLKYRYRVAAAQAMLRLEKLDSEVAVN
jgi:hypothetical protein